MLKFPFWLVENPFLLLMVALTPFSGIEKLSESKITPLKCIGFTVFVVS